MTEKKDTLNWNEKTSSSFKKAYKKAVKESRVTFMFEQNEFVTDYAKYLIEYLDDKLK